MLTIGIVDDGVGFVPALNKLKQTVSADYLCVVCGEDFPLGEQTSSRLLSVGEKALRFCADMGCNAVVFSSVALSSRCLKALSPTSPVAFFGCEAPVVHASSYTASQVLLAGDSFALRNRSVRAIAVPMPRFPSLAEADSERDIVSYVSELCEPFDGQFDCIALANSSMNMYKHCFSRVFPNVKIFDSLEGVARRIRKTYKKYPRDDGVCRVVTLNGEDITDKYSFFID